MSVIKSFYLIFLLGTLTSVLHAQEDIEEGSKQFIDHPDKNEYLLSQPGTDKHKYGYELRENKHFHHTTTELDGVRLGCYGYVLDSKKYSTQYVADIKGYRPVYTYDIIEVFPKSGGTREASFIRNFDESEDKSGNLRYFFPEGCRGFDSEIPAEKNPMTPLIIGSSSSANTNGPSRNKFPVLPNPPKITPSNPPPSQRTPPNNNNNNNKTPFSQIPSLPKSPAQKYLPPAQKYLPPAQQQQPISGKFITKAPAKSFPPVVLKPNPKPFSPQQQQQPIPKASPPIQNKISTATKNGAGGCVGCCVDEESLPKIVIPIKLKNGRSESCPSYAKLIVPADSVSVNSLKSNPTELAKMVLQSLT